MKRLYSTTDFLMLSASERIVGYCILNKDFLILKRAKWADPYFPNLETTIQNAYSTHLGISNVKELKDSTEALYTVLNPAIDLLGEFKVQIEVDFDKKEAANILQLLGFTFHKKGTYTNHQTETIELLQTFNNNLTTELEQEIAAELGQEIITQLKGYAKTVRESNAIQEKAKGTRPEISDENIKALNTIYDEVINICKIAQKFYKKDPVKKALFVFNNSLPGKRKSATQPEPEPQPGS